MTPSLHVILTVFLGFFLFHGSLSQKITIISPTSGTVIRPGQQLAITISTENSSSNVKRLSLTTGFKSERESNPSALGAPLVSNLVVDRDVLMDTKDFTYHYTITVPEASKFVNGIPKSYMLTVGQYYLSGASFVPEFQASTVQVNLEK